jgi:hypothetical protein
VHLKRLMCWRSGLQLVALLRGDWTMTMLFSSVDQSIGELTLHGLLTGAVEVEEAGH